MDSKKTTTVLERQPVDELGAAIRRMSQKRRDEILQRIAPPRKEKRTV